MVEAEAARTGYEYEVGESCGNELLDSVLARTAEKLDLPWTSASEFANRLNNCLAPVVRGQMQKLTAEEMQIAAHLCTKHRLDPFLKQIYVLKTKSGKLQPYVPIDGWISIVNGKDEHDGVEFRFGPPVEFERESTVYNNGKKSTETITVRGPEWCEAIFHIRGKSHPVVVPERLDECWRDSGPWKEGTSRQLRHKAYIQGARVAYGIAGLMDQDEALDRARFDEGRAQAAEKRSGAPLDTKSVMPASASPPPETEPEPAPEAPAEPEPREPTEEDLAFWGGANPSPKGDPEA